ncbi:MAG TPA: nuclear transport factor 2 family protein [Pseudomonadota bacterium]|nr:nuclear transport factor 2 family protein [Pseudomonadota bacterium]HND12598.1 nuclear transport factor 2 family protein [Pseudomonadota bacterium]
MPTVTPEFANHFAESWIAAWNAHDLDAILHHYSDDVVFSSPLIPKIAGEPSGVLCGKPAIRLYWQRGLSLLPNLHFSLLHVLCGMSEVTLVYKGHRGIVAETFFFQESGQVVRACACYAEPP